LNINELIIVFVHGKYNIYTKYKANVFTCNYKQHINRLLTTYQQVINKPLQIIYRIHINRE